MCDHEISKDKENIREIKVLNILSRENRERIARCLKFLSIMRREFNGMPVFEPNSFNRISFNDSSYLYYSSVTENVLYFGGNKLPRDFISRNFQPIKDYIYYLYSRILKDEEVILNVRLECRIVLDDEYISNEKIIGIGESPCLLNEINIFLFYLMKTFSSGVIFDNFDIGFSMEEEDDEEEEFYSQPKPTYLSSRECSVCYDEESCVLFTECGHIPICVACDKTNKCPICMKESIKKFIIPPSKT